MMIITLFRFCATCALCLDLLGVLIVLSYPEQVVDLPSPAYIDYFRLEHGVFPSVLLALCRLVSMIAFAQLFAAGAQLHSMSFIYACMLGNACVVSLNWWFLRRRNAVEPEQASLFIMSAISIVCHIICARHLRSSIVNIPSFTLGLTGKLERALQHREEEALFLPDDAETGFALSSPPSTPARLSHERKRGSRLLHSLKKKMRVAEQAWKASLTDIRHLLVRNYDNFALLGRSSPSSKLFYVLFSIFIDDNLQTKQESLAQLLDVFAESPEEITFFIPQLVVYLLFGAFELESSLQSGLLYMCSHNLTFAYRLEWYLQAFCLRESQSVRGTTASASQDDESLQLVFDLIQAIRRCGENAARRVIHTPQLEYVQIPTYGSIPRALERYPLCLTKEMVLLSKSSPEQQREAFRDVYLGNIRFWTALVDISRRIVEVPLHMRKEALHQSLTQLNDEFLPSAIIHVPFHNPYHRVFSIQVEECFAFCTKDRAPLLVCLEVVHYNSKRRKSGKKKSWWTRPMRTDVQRVSQHKHAISELPPTTWHLDERSDLFEGKHTDESNSPKDQGESEFYQSSSAISRRNSIEQSMMVAAADGASAFSTPADVRDVIGQWASPFHSGKLSTRTRKSDLSVVQESSPLLSTTQHEDASYDNGIYATPLREPGIGNLHREFDLEASLDRGNNNDQCSNIPVPTGSSKAWSSPSHTTPIRKPIFSPSTPLVTPDNNNNNSNNKNKNKNHNHNNGDDIEQHSPCSPEAEACISDGVVFKEKWRDKEQRICETSSAGRCLGWNLIPVIVKSNDDLRQEQLAAQAIRYMHVILQEAKIDCWLRPYDIVALSADSGIIEAIPNTVSLDVLKRREFGYSSLVTFFRDYFGPVDSRRSRNATDNFIESMAGYSIVCYLLNIKDRHNGNILLTTHGHIVHIDFGFLLEKTPGGNLRFEAAPFKLTSEYVEVMGGYDSAGFAKFRAICIRTFLELRRHYERVILTMEMMSRGNENMPCFGGNPAKALREMRARFFPDINDVAAVEAVYELINRSLNNWTTTAYDSYQRCCQGIQ